MPETRVERGLRASPYPGLESYSEQDSEFFFGRDAEARVIVANLLSSRLTLLFGPSGVGKSSVLRAGVMGGLRARARARLEEDDSPGIAAVALSEWHDDPLMAVKSGCLEAVRDLLGRTDLPEPRPDATLSDVIEHWADQVGGRLLFIFDQFEEYFLYHSDGGFDQQLSNAVTSPDVRANFLFAVREDGLARLDRFKGRIPRLFENRLQIHRLSVTAAREAMIGPLVEYNRHLPAGEDPFTIDDDLVASVLADFDVLARSPTTTSGGAGRADDTPSGDAQVEAPIMQLVLTAIWNCETEQGSRRLRANTLLELGGVQEVVRDRLECRMAALGAAEQDVAAAVFQFLVTPSEAKIAWSAAELAEFAEVPEQTIAPVLATLSAVDARILRPVPSPQGVVGTRYEIFHDVLAVPIRDWRVAHIASDEAREVARRRLLRTMQVLGSLAAIAIVTVAIVAWRQRDAAQQQRNEARQQSHLATLRAQQLSVANARVRDEKLHVETANARLQAALKKLHAADAAKTSIVSGLLLVQGIKDTVGAGTDRQLRVLDFQFNRNRSRPVAYQIQFEPTSSNSSFFRDVKIWVWPTDQTGKTYGFARHSTGQLVTYQWQLTHGATERAGTYWTPIGPDGCLGARNYHLGRGNTDRGRINLIWLGANCGDYPAGWDTVDAALRQIARTT
jgi:hypothetical protein